MHDLRPDVLALAVGTQRVLPRARRIDLFYLHLGVQRHDVWPNEGEKQETQQADQADQPDRIACQQAHSRPTPNQNIKYAMQDRRASRPSLYTHDCSPPMRMRGSRKL